MTYIKPQAEMYQVVLAAHESLLQATEGLVYLSWSPSQGTVDFNNGKGRPGDKANVFGLAPTLLQGRYTFPVVVSGQGTTEVCDDVASLRNALASKLKHPDVAAAVREVMRAPKVRGSFLGSRHRRKSRPP